MTSDLAEQARALAETAGVRARDDLALLRVLGDERRSWLNGQITNDVRQLGPGASVYALAVNVRGKVLADLWVLERTDQFLLALPAAALDAVSESFERQIIMEDVELSPAPELRCISVQGPRAGDVLAGVETRLERYPCDELGFGGQLVVLEQGELPASLAQLVGSAEAVGGCAVSERGFELARVRAGRPRFGRDFWDQHYPQEAGLKELAVSFNKGCYLGQEVVCTLENRGKLTRVLVRLALGEGPAPDAGAELRDADGGGNPGQLTSVVHDPETGRTLALGYARRAQSAVGTELRAGEARFKVLGLAGA
jgi:folate-binding protein YgfZ